MTLDHHEREIISERERRKKNQTERKKKLG
jgi:hypothetical protein